MRYYVMGGDGQRYGPVDIPTLNQWAAEGRLRAETELEDSTTGLRLTAASVPGLVLAPQTPPEVPGFNPPPGNPYQQPPGPYSNYPRGGYGQTSSAGSGELIAAWVLGAVTVVSCCPVLPIVGLVLANKAIQAGNQGASAARTFNIVMLVLTSLVYIFYIGIFALAGLGGAFR